MHSPCSPMNSAQNEPILLRRIPNDGLSLFLNLLRFSVKDSVRKPFTRNSCMHSLPNGWVPWDEIVMDDTATGILSILLEFHWQVRVLNWLKMFSKVHYTIPIPKHREFIDHIFRNPEKQERKSNFGLAMTEELCNNSSYLVRIFLSFKNITQSIPIHLTVRNFSDNLLRKCHGNQ